MSTSKPVPLHHDCERGEFRPMEYALDQADTKTSARFSVACIIISMVPWLVIGVVAQSHLFTGNEEYMGAVLVFLLAAQLMALTFAALSAQAAWPETQVGRFMAVGLGLGASSILVVVTYDWSVYTNYFVRTCVGLGGMYAGLAVEIATGACQRCIESRSSTRS